MRRDPILGRLYEITRSARIHISITTKRGRPVWTVVGSGWRELERLLRVLDRKRPLKTGDLSAAQRRAIAAGKDIR